MALNLNRQVVVIGLPGGDPARARTIAGPYLFRADENLTPVLMGLHDIDGDGQIDLLLDVRHEQIVYLNKDGSFRQPTPNDQVVLKPGSGKRATLLCRTSLVPSSKHISLGLLVTRWALMRA